MDVLEEEDLGRKTGGKFEMVLSSEPNGSFRSHYTENESLDHHRL